MKKILVFSDIHGNTNNLLAFSPLLNRCDMAIFLGDGIGSLEILHHAIQKKITAIRGNCDFFCPLPSEILLEVEGKKIFATHGHQYDVKHGTAALAREAASCNADLVLYGHTHTCSIEHKGSMIIVNVPPLGTSRTKCGGGFVEVTITKNNIKVNFKNLNY